MPGLFLWPARRSSRRRLNFIAKYFFLFNASVVVVDSATVVAVKDGIPENVRHLHPGSLSVKVGGRTREPGQVMALGGNAVYKTACTCYPGTESVSIRI